MFLRCRQPHQRLQDHGPMHMPPTLANIPHQLMQQQHPRCNQRRVASAALLRVRQAALPTNSTLHLGSNGAKQTARSRRQGQLAPCVQDALAKRSTNSGAMPSHAASPGQLPLASSMCCVTAVSNAGPAARCFAVDRSHRFPSRCTARRTLLRGRRVAPCQLILLFDQGAKLTQRRRSLRRSHRLAEALRPGLLFLF